MSRVKEIQKKLSTEELDALLITSEYNLRYASGFTGTTGLAVITREKAFFVTDFRYTEQAAKQAKGYEIVQNTGPIYDEVKRISSEQKVETMGFEKNHVTYATYQLLEELLECNLKPISGIVESLREVKTEEEVKLIQQAIHITEKAFEHILTYIKPGQTEIEIANELDFYMRKQGASGVSFETIVASGARSAMPHGVASEKKIEHGDMITIDFGCYYKGYVSDITRTFAVGDPGKKLREIYQIVLNANRKVAKEAKPNMTGAELDAIARDYIAEKGYGEAFGHSTGHGIGVEVHEEPGINFRNTKPLVAGNIITDEPGIYIPGVGGVRIEDDLLITEEGNKSLTSCSRELIIL